MGINFDGARRQCCYVTDVFWRTVLSVRILGDNTAGALPGRHMGDQNRKGTGKYIYMFHEIPVYYPYI
jgi:hypothetical protein